MKNVKLKHRNRIPQFLLPAVLVLAAALLSGCQQKEILESSEPSEESIVEETVDLTKFADGTVLAGRDISGRTVEEAEETAKEYLEGALEGIEISVKFQEDTILLRGKDFAYEESLSPTLPEILAERKPGEYELQYTVSLAAEGKAKLEEAAQNCTSEGVNSTVTGYDPGSGVFSFSDEIFGGKPNLEKTLENIEALLDKKSGGALQADFTESEPTVTKAFLSENFKMISSYSTVSENTENGNTNMRLALDHVNGTVLQPGQVFSYNGTIGDSTTTENGYMAAGGISGGVMVQMIGGGICQGSSTIYGAVLRAGLEIVERHCHGIQSSYCPIGQDAMVDYGSADLQFSNNSGMPIYIMSWMDGVTLNVQIYGVQPEGWDTIEVYSENVGTYPALTEVSYRQNNNLAYGQYELVSSGRSGAEAIASRTYYKNGEVVWTEELPSSYYPPSGVVYNYGPGTDVNSINTSQQSGNTGSWSEPEPEYVPEPEPEPVPEEQPTPEAEQPVSQPDPAAEQVPETETETVADAPAAEQGTEGGTE